MVLITIDPRKIYYSIVAKFQPTTDRLYRNHKRILRFTVGFIIGMQFWFWINATFAVINFIGATLMGISIAIILFFFKLLGVEEIAERLIDILLEFVGTMDDVDDGFDLLPAVGDIAASLIEFVTDITRVIARLGKAIFANFVILFPVLTDIEIDIDWLHVSLPYLVRTLFNVAQFFAVYYFYRKIKARLRARITKEIELTKYEWFG